MTAESAVAVAGGFRWPWEARCGHADTGARVPGFFWGADWHLGCARR